MDAELVERLRYKQQVADRLAAQTPNNVRGPHCWYCGSGSPWFSCECKKAQEAQKARDLGKREGYPRFNVKLNCIENLDEETIRFNETLGFKRYVPPDVIALPPPVHAEPEAVHAVETVDTPTVESVHANETAPPSVDNVDSNAARRAYKAEHERMRRKRERDRAAREGA